MKTELTKEQSRHLIDLGVPEEMASMTSNQTERGEVYYNDYYQGIFTLDDLLEILPKKIETEIGQGELYMNYKVLNGDIYAVAYYTIYLSTAYYRIPIEYKPYKELIDALYELTIWCIENGYLKLAKE